MKISKEHYEALEKSCIHWDENVQEAEKLFAKVGNVKLYLETILENDCNFNSGVSTCALCKFNFGCNTCVLYKSGNGCCKKNSVYEKTQPIRSPIISVLQWLNNVKAMRDLLYQIKNEVEVE